MSQGYAIELYFDPALENQVLKAWNVLARRQISTQLIEIESRPHITLFSSQFVDPSKLENIVKTLALKQEALPLSFSSIGTLPNDKNVLFLAPTPSIPLLQFHLQLCEAMKKEGIEIGDEYKPDLWIPFCPVAEQVPKSRMGEAFTVLRELKLPVDGYAMDIGLVEFSPIRELFSFMLGNTVDGPIACFALVEELKNASYMLGKKVDAYVQRVYFSNGYLRLKVDEFCLQCSNVTYGSFDYVLNLTNMGASK